MEQPLAFSIIVRATYEEDLKTHARQQECFMNCICRGSTTHFHFWDLTVMTHWASAGTLCTHNAHPIPLEIENQDPIACFVQIWDEQVRVVVVLKTTEPDRKFRHPNFRRNHCDAQAGGKRRTRVRLRRSFHALHAPGWENRWQNCWKSSGAFPNFLCFSQTLPTAEKGGLAALVKHLNTHKSHKL